MNAYPPPKLFEPETTARLRAELPSTASVVYLNGGTVGPIPRAATAAMRDELERQSEFRQSAGVWEALTRAQALAREVTARLVGLRPDQIALMHATHEGINTALWALDISPGDSIVTTDHEHPGVLVPLHAQTERRGSVTRTAAWHGDLDVVDAIAAQIDDTTIAVVVSHVSWTTGAIIDLAALRAAVGPDVRIIIDGAQGAGVVPVNARRDGWDAYTVSGQKWTLGPHGTGALALVLPERWLSTCCSMSAIMNPCAPNSTTCISSAPRFEQAQEAALPLLGYGVSASMVVDEIGVDAIFAHTRALARQLRKGLAEFDGWVAMGEAHIVCVDVEPGTAPAVVEALFAQGIQIRNLGEDRIRISLGFWNTPEEVTAVLGALSTWRG